jgi:predicted N-acetyltransferase YhbS
MVTIRLERSTDAAAREALLDRAYGDVRFDKPSERLRAGRLPADGLSFAAVEDGRLVGTVRLWHVAAGRDRPALLLGPLAVAPDHQRRGIGASLMQRALREARRRGHRAVLLVGDAAYYGRFGFSADKSAALRLPGPCQPERLLALELIPGSLDGAKGTMRATGAPMPQGLPAFLVGPTRTRAAIPRAA